jgi:hypothetical protein
MYLNSALDRADEYRAASLDRANRGRASGKHAHRVYATSRAMDEATGGATMGEQVAYTIREAFRIDRDNALHVLHVALFGDEFDGVTL